MTRHNGSSHPRATVRLAGTLLVAAISVTGCTDWAGYDLDYIMGRTRVLSTMRSTISFEAQDLTLLPPVGTVPVAGPGSGGPPPFGQAELESIAAGLPNPVEPTAEALARGELLYANQCAVCHGAQGEGNGPIIGNGRFPLGPPLDSGIAAGRTDGYIYGVIRVGRGLMPSYGDRIGNEDRWAVVHYVRQLQGQSAGGASAASAQLPTATQIPAADPATAAAPGGDAGAVAPVTPAAVPPADQGQ